MSPEKKRGPARPPIALVTDFGGDDWYAGVIKGVLATRAPDVPVIDVTHGVPPGAVHTAAFVLESAWPWFPPGTVFLVIVDPGVGTDRRPLAVKAGRCTFVGPDNGVLTPALALPDAEARVIVAERLGVSRLSRTFHGRDLFAPAAAFLSGGRFEAIGEVVADAVRLDPDPVVIRPGRLTGRVIHVDRFGNCITDLGEPEVLAFRDAHPSARLRVVAGGTVIEGLVETYGRAEPGVPCALIGSSGRLEIAVREGNASAELGLGRGSTVELGTAREDQ